MNPPTAGFADPEPPRRRRCVLDASVLYQEVLRNLLLWIAVEGGFDPFWTERILDETCRNLIEDGLIDAKQWDRLRGAMLRSFPDAMVDQRVVDAIEGEMPNDEKDRHVLAAAVAGNVEVVITSNVRHFEQADLAKVDKQALSPDQLLCELLATEPARIHTAMNQLTTVMRVPRGWSVAELLGRLSGLGHGDALAPRFARAASAKLNIEMTAPPDRTTL
jgi:predicted nucleic acid-binding protein